MPTAERGGSVSPEASLRAGVVGSPIAHSLSPVLHRAAYRVLGAPLHYDRHEVPDGGLAEFLSEVASAPGWRGLSVTMPHKQDAARLAGQVSDRVALLGAANTLVWDSPHAPGQWWAHNTDVDGIIGALRFAGLAALPPGASVAVLGNGGTATAAVLAARDLGADAVAVHVRSAARAAAVVELAKRIGLRAAAHRLEDFPGAAESYAGVICTLPPRAADPLAAALEQRGRCEGPALPRLLDVAYDPWPSALAQAWQARGGSVVSGIEMLLYQAREQVALFAGQDGRDGDPGDPVLAAMAAAVGLPERGRA
ncbi:MAG: shikimate dehydrogenase [Micrococcus sp.]|nr:shikimate dehydrogenase [Micrococcus sp.]